MLWQKYKLTRTFSVWYIIWLYVQITSCAKSSDVKDVKSAQKVSFSCVGRPSGYYADIDTGCQVYHMCDGLGRQFSYSCPNTTLFQQRMLICDHWYMVNCSKSERDYTVNALIGQRNKPFVNDDETNFRTPRPELLDRNYLSDYSNSFLNLPLKNYQPTTQAENINAQNSLKSNNRQQQHWRISGPSQKILPPSHVKALDGSALNVVTSIRREGKQEHRRRDFKQADRSEVHQIDVEDLGTSHSTRYNTSADFEDAQPQILQNEQKSKQQTRTNVNQPSRIYQPPYLYPIYNLNDTVQRTKTPLQVSTAAPFQVRSTSKARSLLDSSYSTTTSQPPSHPTTLRGKPFTIGASLVKANHSKTQNVTTQPISVGKEANKITPAQGFLPLLKQTSSPMQPAKDKMLVPEKILLPPHTEFTVYDVASTQGPPVYYAFKEPTNGLQPPKLDPPFGVNGREYPETVIDYAAIQGQFFPTNSLTSIAEQKTHTDNNNRNSIFSIRSTKSLNPAAIGKNDAKGATTKIQDDLPETKRNSKDIGELKKWLSVPEFTFPLETAARNGYEAGNYNSFQLKIPEQQQHWYGENPKCPECHPSFVVQGTCEPCIKR